MSYAELHCLSHYSFLRGASHPAELVNTAKDLGYSALAITDECSLAGVVKAHTAAKACDLKLIIGSEFKLDNQRLIVLVTNRPAYSELSSLITLSRRRSIKGEYILHWSDLEHNLHSGLIIWLPSKNLDCDTLRVQDLLRWSDGRLWIGVEHLLDGHEIDNYHYLRNLSALWQIPLVACGDVHMHDKHSRPLQDTLTAIRHNCSVMELGEKRFSNAERHLRTLDKLQKVYPAALLSETLKITMQCSFSLEELRYEYPKEVVPENISPKQQLRYLVEIGIRKRWPQGILSSVREQIEYELNIIVELRYEYYFLTVHDIVDFARSRDIFCQGRGSAANSVVCYCLFITEVSPDQVSLLFERFISKERNEPPDIDVDFEHERREEVIQYIYKKYSRERAALAATVITYKPRSAIRDVGKALGLDPHFIQQLSQSISWWERGEDLTKRFNERGIDQSGLLSKKFYLLLRSIIGTPRHLSQHVGGFIITDSPISSLVPVENASMPERTVIQWDKEDIEALGLLKIDILALGMLSAIHHCLKLIQKHHGQALSMQKIPANDKATYDMLCAADSIGVFQIESRAQMAMLPRLKPRSFYDLVIEIAIVRPGPIQGGMVHPYLRRRQGLEDINYPNAEIKKVLERTLGIPVFQEQVIRLAMVAAGFSGGEADQLRRAMASWGKNSYLNRFERKLVDGMLERGYTLDFAQRLYKQIQGFGVYGFPESHSASFALLAYVSAWLKCHYPEAFYCALLNSQPMGFYSPSQLVQDARRKGIKIAPIDINRSNWDHSLEKESSNEDTLILRLGYRLIIGMSKTVAERIVKARNPDTSKAFFFTSIPELIQRASIPKSQLTLLGTAGALNTLAGDQRKAHWQILDSGAGGPLLESTTNINAKKHSITFIDDSAQNLKKLSEVEQLHADYESTGLTLGRHPMSLLREQFKIFMHCKPHAELALLSDRRFVRMAGLVTGRQRPGTASGVIFLTLEDETGNSNVIVWKTIQKRCHQALLRGQLLEVKGVIETEGSVVNVVAQELIDHTDLLYKTKIRSRDFR